MKKSTKGWVVINIGHPQNGNKYICDNTLARTRKESITRFLDHSGYGYGSQWRFWREKYNFRCVKAEAIIVAEEEKTSLTESKEDLDKMMEDLLIFGIYAYTETKDGKLKYYDIIEDQENIIKNNNQSET